MVALAFMSFVFCLSSVNRDPSHIKLYYLQALLRPTNFPLFFSLLVSNKRDPQTVVSKNALNSFFWTLGLSICGCLHKTKWSVIIFKKKNVGNYPIQVKFPFSPLVWRKMLTSMMLLFSVFLYIQRKKNFSLCIHRFLTLHTVFLKGRGIISLLPLHNENHIQIC